MKPYSASNFKQVYCEECQLCNNHVIGFCFQFHLKNPFLFNTTIAPKLQIFPGFSLGSFHEECEFIINTFCASGVCKKGTHGCEEIVKCVDKFAEQIVKTGTHNDVVDAEFTDSPTQSKVIKQEDKVSVLYGGCDSWCQMVKERMG